MISRPAHTPVRIEGPRARLRDWRTTDGDRLTSLLDPSRPWHDTNGPYFGRPDHADMARARAAWMEDAASDPADLPDPRRTLAIAQPHDDVVVGCVSWYWESEETDWRRLGIVVHDESTWGTGVGTDALRLWTGYLFDRTDALRLDLATYSGNVAMTALAQRLGFVEEGRMRRARRWSGGVHDALVYGVLREEWAQRSRPPGGSPP